MFFWTFLTRPGGGPLLCNFYLLHASLEIPDDNLFDIIMWLHGPYLAHRYPRYVWKRRSVRQHGDGGEIDSVCQRARHDAAERTTETTETERQQRYRPRSHKRFDDNGTYGPEICLGWKVGGYRRKVVLSHCCLQNVNSLVVWGYWSRVASMFCSGTMPRSDVLLCL